MAKLSYSAIASLDGFVADETGNFDWAAPDEEVHKFVNERERPVGTYLYGRRMYDVMRFWETEAAVTGQPAFVQDYAKIWRAADKIVYSTTLDAVASARTRIERDFDPEGARHQHWRIRPRRSGAQGRAGRCDPAFPDTRRRRRRPCRAPERYPTEP